MIWACAQVAAAAASRHAAGIVRSRWRDTGDRRGPVAPGSPLWVQTPDQPSSNCCLEDGGVPSLLLVVPQERADSDVAEMNRVSVILQFDGGPSRFQACRGRFACASSDREYGVAWCTTIQPGGPANRPGQRRRARREDGEPLRAGQPGLVQTVAHLPEILEQHQIGDGRVSMDQDRLSVSRYGETRWLERRPDAPDDPYPARRGIELLDRNLRARRPGQHVPVGLIAIPPAAARAVSTRGCP